MKPGANRVTQLAVDGPEGRRLCRLAGTGHNRLALYPTSHWGGRQEFTSRDDSVGGTSLRTLQVLTVWKYRKRNIGKYRPGKKERFF